MGVLSMCLTAFLVRSLRRRWIKLPHREKAYGLELEYLYEYRAWPSGKDITKVFWKSLKRKPS
jgi:hypothetical protein